MGRKWSARVVGGLVVFVVIGYLLSMTFSAPELVNGKTAKLKLDTATVTVTVAGSDAARSKGLGGRTSLPDGQGLVFVFDSPTQPMFWMKGVSFPIDIIWVNGNTITEVTANVPPAPAGVPDEQLPKYQPAGPINRAVEVPAGWAAKHNIQPGDPFSVL